MKIKAEKERKKKKRIIGFYVQPQRNKGSQKLLGKFGLC